MAVEISTSVIPEFVKSITPDMIGVALAASLHRGNPLERYDGNFYTIKGCLNKNTERLLPNWLNLNGYLSELFRLGSPKFWITILDSLDQQNYPLVSSLRDLCSSNGLFVPPRNSANNTDVAKMIVSSNAHFYTLSTQFTGLAAALGPNFRTITNRAARAESSYEGASSIGDYFWRVAQDGEELIDRLIRCFSSNQGDGLAIQALNKNGGFKQEHLMLFNTIATSRCPVRGLTRIAYGLVVAVGGRRKTKVCPAVGITRAIYNEYANYLSTPEYRILFLNTVTRTG